MVSHEKVLKGCRASQKDRELRSPKQGSQMNKKVKLLNQIKVISPTVVALIRRNTGLQNLYLENSKCDKKRHDHPFVDNHSSNEDEDSWKYHTFVQTPKNSKHMCICAYQYMFSIERKPLQNGD